MAGEQGTADEEAGPADPGRPAEESWQAPGASAPQPLPQYGERLPQYGERLPQYGEHAPGAAPTPPVPQYGYQPGWAPPPKPGLIPIRPLGFGTLIGAPFQVLRRNPKVTVGAALLIQGIPQAIVSLLIIGGITYLFGRVDDASSADRGAIFAGSIGWAIVLGLVSLIISAVSTSVLQGIVVNEVAREVLGEKLTLGSLWRLTRGRLGALIGWSLLLTLAYGIAAAVVVLIAVALFASGGALVIAGVLFSVFGSLAAIAVAFWLTFKLVLVPSAIVLERLPIRTAMARSWRLTNGFFWKTAGVILLIMVIIYAVTQIITTPIALIGGFLGALSNPTGLGSSSADPVAQLIVAQFGINVVSTLVSAVIGAVLAVVQSSAVALVYVDLRMRKEGLDLELVRFIEARQAGAAGTRDPFQTPAGPTMPVPPVPPYPNQPPA